MVSRPVKIFAILGLSAIGLILMMRGIGAGLEQYFKSKPLDVHQIEFIIDDRSGAVTDQKLVVLRARRKGDQKASGQFFWSSGGGSGIWVRMSRVTETIYGEDFVRTQTAAHTAYHRIGQVDKMGQFTFVPGAMFEYTPHDATVGNVISVRIPGETTAEFTQPVREK